MIYICIQMLNKLYGNSFTTFKIEMFLIISRTLLIKMNNKEIYKNMFQQINVYTTHI